MPVSLLSQRCLRRFLQIDSSNFFGNSVFLWDVMKEKRTAVFEHTWKILESLENGEVPLAIMLDLAKTPHGVNHKMLL